MFYFFSNLNLRQLFSLSLPFVTLTVLENIGNLRLLSFFVIGYMACFMGVITAPKGLKRKKFNTKNRSKIGAENVQDL